MHVFGANDGNDGRNRAGSRRVFIDYWRLQMRLWVPIQKNDGIAESLISDSLHVKPESSLWRIILIADPKLQVTLKVQIVQQVV